MYDGVAVATMVSVATPVLSQSEFQNCIQGFAYGAIGSFLVVMGLGLIAYLIKNMFALFRS